MHFAHSGKRNEKEILIKTIKVIKLYKIVTDRQTICVFPKSPHFKLRATTLKLLICLEKEICQMNLHLKELSARTE